MVNVSSPRNSIDLGVVLSCTTLQINRSLTTLQIYIYMTVFPLSPLAVQNALPTNGMRA